MEYTKDFLDRVANAYLSLCDREPNAELIDAYFEAAGQDAPFVTRTTRGRISVNDETKYGEFIKAFLQAAQGLKLPPIELLSGIELELTPVSAPTYRKKGVESLIKIIPKKGGFRVVEVGEGCVMASDGRALVKLSSTQFAEYAGKTLKFDSLSAKLSGDSVADVDLVSHDHPRYAKFLEACPKGKGVKVNIEGLLSRVNALRWADSNVSSLSPLFVFDTGKMARKVPLKALYNLLLTLRSNGGETAEVLLVGGAPYVQILADNGNCAVVASAPIRSLSAPFIYSKYTLYAE